MTQALFSLDGQSLILPASINGRLDPSAPSDDAARLQLAQAEFSILISLALQRFSNKVNVPETVKWLIGELHTIRHKFGPRVWQQMIPFIQAHPSAEILQQCPFTRWSFEKPRGYSGDASLIDFIYRHPAVDAEMARSTEMGLEIFEYTINAPGPVAVRERRDLLTAHVDATADRVDDGAEILAVAAGHLREAEASTALAGKRLKRWVALDQDPQSIGSIASQFHGTAVEAIDGSVRSLLARKHAIGTFDLIYAAGLYDYLADRVAIKLTQTCLDMLKPGGVFLFANFTDEMADDGYMESYMNWELLQRSEADMWRIAHESADGIAARKKVWFGTNRNIIYATIEKL